MDYTGTPGRGGMMDYTGTPGRGVGMMDFTGTLELCGVLGNMGGGGYTVLGGGYPRDIRRGIGGVGMGGLG
jgi:hypothetical protein